jgi:hypothetical protein
MNGMIGGREAAQNKDANRLYPSDQASSVPISLLLIWLNFVNSVKKQTG